MSKIRYIICFEYLGLNFFGSQKQPNKRTVQETIEKALRTLIKDEINIIPSGRTDAKVSAEFQAAHFDCEFDFKFDCEIDSEIDSGIDCKIGSKFGCQKEISNKDRFLYSLNSILPDDIKVFEIKKVDFNFHAQKSARYKHYRYTILNNRVASVFNNCALYYPYKVLDIERLNASLSYLIGHHDFSAFKSNSTNPYNDCEIYYAKAKRIIENRLNFVFIDIVGNRFLYNMVRTIVGQLLMIERHNLEPKVMDEILKSKDRTKAANVMDAYPLKLMYVGYDDVENYIQNKLKEGK